LFSRQSPFAPSPTTPTSEALQGWSLKLENGVSFPAKTFVTRERAVPVSLTTAYSIPGSNVSLGKYSLFFGGGGDSLTPVYHLSQTGVVPVDASWLVFYLDDPFISSLPQPNGFLCLVNGSAANLFIGPAFTHVYYADVSGYAGQEVNLQFVFGKSFSHSFDIAGFTTVPEPSSYALLGLGAALLWYHRRHRPR
jgi:hypothetical protein